MRKRLIKGKFRRAREAGLTCTGFLVIFLCFPPLFELTATAAFSVCLLAGQRNRRNKSQKCLFSLEVHVSSGTARSEVRASEYKRTNERNCDVQETLPKHAASLWAVG